jgi:transposase
MRHASGGGPTVGERQRHEQLRLEMARWFRPGEKAKKIAASLRVTERTVERWCKARRQQGSQGCCRRPSRYRGLTRGSSPGWRPN